MLCAVWYHLYYLKIVKNTHGGRLFFVMLATEAETCNFAIVTLLHGCFSRFNDTQLPLVFYQGHFYRVENNSILVKVAQ